MPRPPLPSQDLRVRSRPEILFQWVLLDLGEQRNFGGELVANAATSRLHESWCRFSDHPYPLDPNPSLSDISDVMWRSSLKSAHIVLGRMVRSEMHVFIHRNE